MKNNEPNLSPETVEAFKKLLPNVFAEAEAKHLAERKRAWRNFGILVAAFVIVGSAAVYGIMQSQVGLGKTAIIEFARDNDLCAISDCAEGVKIFHLAAKDAYGMDGTMLEYCLGVDSWSGLRVRRGGAFISLARRVLGVPCGALYGESAVQPITN